MRSTVFFDLDGTLLPLDMDEFLKLYFAAVKMSGFYDRISKENGEKIFNAGVRAMLKNDGQALNSGVFFRALPGQFWSGYEAQIHNQWEGDDRTKPVDYGTGGIYNRQPARRVVSSDHEWFSKTIVAHGRHIAVWVNGYQVSDWTDPRPLNESARQGCRLKPGVISLQGHDPTTDLSFRNLRIGELPAAQP